MTRKRTMRKGQSGTFKVGTAVRFKGKTHGGEVIDSFKQGTPDEIALVRILHLDGPLKGREIRVGWYSVHYLEEA